MRCNLAGRSRDDRPFRKAGEDTTPVVEAVLVQRQLVRLMGVVG
jgi:hypothetical protein